MNYFPQLPDSSRIWIYQSQTIIPVADQLKIAEYLSKFVKGWAAHGTPLVADAMIAEDYFVIFAVDTSKVGASGCSIDTSVRFIRTIGEDFNLDFFNRLNILIENHGVKEIIHFNELSNHLDATFYNPTIQSLGELRTKWKQKVSESQFV